MITPQEIEELRKEGMSDEQILTGYRKLDKANDEDVAALLDAGLKPKDILSGLAGYKPKEEPKAETWGQTAVNVGKGLLYGLGDAVAGYGKTAEAVGAETAGNAGVAAGRMVAPKGYEPAASKVDVFKPSTYRNIPMALVESAPGLASDLAAAGVGGSVGALAGGVGAPIGAIVGFAGNNIARNFGRNLEDRLATDGKKLKDATGSDYAISGAATAAEAALNGVGLRGAPIGKLVPAIGSVTKGAGAQAVAQLPAQIGGAAIRDGVANAAGNVVQQVGRTAGTDAGLSVNAHEAANAGGLGAATGAGIRGVLGVRDVYQSSKLSGFMDDDGSSSRVAGALIETELNLTDPRGTKAAMDIVGGQLRRATRNEDAKAFLRDADSETRTAVTDALDRLKIGQELSTAQVADLAARLTGDARAVSLHQNLSDLSTLNKVKGLTVSDGTGGREGRGFGNSAVGRMTNPLNRVGLGAAGALGVATQVPAAAAALAGVTPYGVGILGGAAALQGVGRGVDRLLQTRAPVNEFATRFDGFRQTAPIPVADQPGIPAYAPQQADPRLDRQTDRAWAQFERDQAREAAEAQRRENDFSRAYQTLDVDPQVKARQEEGMWRAQAAQEAAGEAPRGYDRAEAVDAIRQAYAAREQESARIIDAEAAQRAANGQAVARRAQEVDSAYAQAQAEALTAERLRASRERDFARAQAQSGQKAADGAKAAQIEAMYRAQAAQEAAQAAPRSWDDRAAIEAIRQAEAARQAQSAAALQANAIERAAANPTPIDDVITAQPKAQVPPPRTTSERAAAAASKDRPSDKAEAEPKREKAKSGAKSAPEGDFFEFEGIRHPLPEKVERHEAYRESIKRNQARINRAIDRAYDEGQIEQVTYEAIRDRTRDLKTARNKAQARAVVDEIVDNADPVDVPKIRAAFDDKFYGIWKKDQ